MNAAPDSESFDVELNAQDSSLFAEGLTVDGGRAKLVKMSTEMHFVCLLLFVPSFIHAFPFKYKFNLECAPSSAG